MQLSCSSPKAQMSLMNPGISQSPSYTGTLNNVFFLAKYLNTVYKLPPAGHLMLALCPPSPSQSRTITPCSLLLCSAHPSIPGRAFPIWKPKHTKLPLTHCGICYPSIYLELHGRKGTWSLVKLFQTPRILLLIFLSSEFNTECIREFHPVSVASFLKRCTFVPLNLSSLKPREN